MTRYSKKEGFLSRLASRMPWHKSEPVNGYASSVLNSVFAWVFWILCAVWFQSWIEDQELVAVFAIWGVYIAGLIYLRGSRVRVPIRSLLLFILALLFSLSLILNESYPIRNWTVFLLFIGFFVWRYDFAVIGGRRLNDEALAAHLWNGAFKSSGAGVKTFFVSLYRGGEKGRGRRIGRTIGLICIGLAVAFIPTLIISLLLSYDSQFVDLMDRVFFFDDIFENLDVPLRDLFWGLPFAMLMFAALFDAQRKNAMQKGEKVPTLSGARFAPRTLLCAAVTPILLIYVIFFISQWHYYMAAFTHVLPENLTYAEYAREGFFQLCTVCGINAVILIIFRLCMKKDDLKKNDWVTRIYTMIISAFSLLLIATALSKMLLYIRSYGLTQKRVYASWFIILLAFIFTVVLIRQFFTRMQIAGILLVGGLCLSALIVFPNVDMMIADYNVSAYLAGDLKDMDLDTLRELGNSSVPAMLDLESTLKEKENRTEKEEKLLASVGEYYLNPLAHRFRHQKQEFFSFNFTEAHARKLLADRPLPEHEQCNN